MTPDTAIAQARKGKLLPVYLVAGEERFLRDAVVRAIRDACLAGGLADFNEDRFTAGEVDVERVLSAARTVPMMAARRFVLVRSVQRWESGGRSDGGNDASAGESSSESPMDRLAAYAAEPVPTTSVVLVADAVDGRRRLALSAKKQDFLVPCDPLDDRALCQWIGERARDKGHPMAADAAELLAQLSGPDLSTVADALERLSLYVGPEQPIGESAIAECVARVRTADTWALVDAVARRDSGRCLALLADVYDARDRGLPLLGAIAWSVRQLARFKLAEASGASADEAAKRAGVFQPFRARELSQKARPLSVADLERWMLVLAETDLSLKGSRRPPDAVLEEMLLKLCRRGP